MSSLFKKIIAIFVCVAHLFQVSYAAGLLPGTESCVAEPSLQCVDDKPCKTLGGVTVCLNGAAGAPVGASFVPDTCWEYEKSYTCKRYVDTCARYSSDPNCEQQGAPTCGTDAMGQPMVDASGNCIYSTTSYKCTNPANNPVTEQTYTTNSCNQAYSIENQSCIQELVTQVLTPGTACTPGALLAEKTVSRTGGPVSGKDRIRFRAICDTSGSLTFKVHAWGGSGSCTSEQTFTTAKTITSNETKATVRPHWGGSCKTTSVNVLAGSTCNGTNCSFNFTVGSSSSINLTFTEPLGPTTVTENWTDGCGGMSAEPSCNLQDTVCVEGVNETRIIGGVPITKACWKYQKNFACEQYTDGCTAYSTNPACVQSSSTCQTDAVGNPILNLAGSCGSLANEYTCADVMPTYAEVDSQSNCNLGDMSNLDWTIPSNSAAGDFVEAVTTQEFARQIVEYGKNDENGFTNIFAGEPYGCREGSFGLRNCCDADTQGSAQSNNDILSSLAGSAAMSAFTSEAGLAIAKGSTYVYDTLVMADAAVPEFINTALASGMENSMQFSSGIGAFGFGTSATAAGGVFGGASSIAIPNTGLYFNPYALALAVAIQVIMQAMSCNEEEMNLAKLQSKNLCHYVGQYCSSKIMVLGQQVGCNETTDSYCCYNGLLAKAIQEGAHEQLGLSWGSAENPNCSGLSIDQITNLDFSSGEMKNALEPFKQEIMSTYQSRTAPYLQNGTVKGYVQQGAADNSHELCLQRQQMDPTTVCN